MGECEGPVIVLVLTPAQFDLVGDLVDNALPTTKGVHHWHDPATLESLREEVNAVIGLAYWAEDMARP